MGAHAGRWTIPLSGVFRSVVALEPNPYSCIALSEATASMPNVAIWNVGATDEPGIKSLSELDGIPSRSTLYPQFSSLPVSRSFWTYFIKLDDYFRLASLIKVDTEGSEADVLRGARELLRSGARFCIETHSDTLEGQCSAILDSLSLSFRTMTLDEEAPMSLHAQKHEKHKYLVSLDE